MSLKPSNKKNIKIVREYQLNIVPNYDSNGMIKADSG